jgi:uncharacterized membrane protein YdbT with pleckstrin-like domain
MRTRLQKDEQILLVTYSSWTILVMPVILAILGIAAAILIVIKAQTPWGWLAAVVGILYFYLKYLNWKVNLWVVTNYRVIDETGLLRHYAKESPLDKINNVSYDQSVWGRLFNFGHVEIQTAAEVGATDYYNVQHPRRLKDTITQAQAEYKNLQYNTQAQQMAAAMDSRYAAPPRAAQAQAADAPQVAHELEKLFELKMKGAITEEEFQRAKARLLGN